MKFGIIFAEFVGVFRQSEILNIVERALKNDLSKKFHYLLRIPVIILYKETTKIVPLFDPSASDKGKISLNEFLFKGSNLIETIPDILDIFRTVFYLQNGRYRKGFSDVTCYIYGQKFS